MQQPDKKLSPGLILCLGLWACNDNGTTATAPPTPLPTPTVQLTSCHDGASLNLQLSGAINGKFDWRSSEFQCESMRRPDDAGARLRFVGQVDNASLALIVAIPDLVRGEPGKELASNLTLHIEDTARFFGTQGTESCWADINTQELIDSARYGVAGEVYCIAPLSEINGDASISIVEMSFATELDWDLT